MIVAERILILGRTALTDEICAEIERGACGGQYEIAGILDPLADAAPRARWLDAGAILHLEAAVQRTRPDRIVVGMTERRSQLSIRALLEVCTRRGLRVEEAATCYERLTGRVALDSLSPSSIVFSWQLCPPVMGAARGRWIGRGAALAALAALSPLLATIAIAIRLDSEGPVLFVQERLGVHGRPFKLLKFRTMRVAATRTSEWEADNRERVTRVGRWLRRFRLDELPQLLNVVRCEMNLVGPRPHPVSNHDLFTLVGRNLSERTGSAVAYYGLRCTVPPGLTGWAQVRYRYANNLDEEMEKLTYDLYYIKYRSQWLDLRIMLETVKVMFLGHRTATPDPEGRLATPRRGPSFTLRRDRERTTTA